MTKLRTMLPPWIIEKKRDGKNLTDEEISFFMNGFAQDLIPDYQMAALAMAICVRGMSFEETTSLTKAMMKSGDVLDLGRRHELKVDKHSTGGIGDKTSLALAPLVASCGLIVPMISGRGLGITGGTLDKLESIPGFRTDLSEREIRKVVDRCGCVISGATENLAPADKKLYSLRDVTGTVPSIPLITASILSKKLAAGLDALVLDVKWGCGAFMKSQEDARRLALTLTQTCQGLGTPATALLTSMEQPLGQSVGNSLEIVETIDVLSGEGPVDLVKLILALGERMLAHGQVAEGEEAIALLKSKIRSGAAMESFRSMVDAQGGDLKALDNPERLPMTPLTIPVSATDSGYLEKVDAEAIGRACVILGAGRKAAGDSIDSAVGVSSIRKIGEVVQQGDPLAVIHARKEPEMELVLPEIAKAFSISNNRVESPPLISELIEGKKGS